MSEEDCAMAQKTLHRKDLQGRYIEVFLHDDSKFAGKMRAGKGGEKKGQQKGGTS